MNLPGFGQIAEQLRRSTVNINRGGSGVIWNPDGLIVTNAHVVRAIPGRLEAELWDGRRLDARCLAIDPRRDLAILETGASSLPAATPSDSSQLRPGQIAIAVGNPLGFTGALSTGVIHAVGPLSGLGRQPWVQAAVRLAPGNSGGPLADARGRVVGINTMVAGRLALAVPSNAVAAFLNQGSSSRTIGVTLRPIPRLGLLLLSVEPGSPAQTASLLPGDILTAVNGSRITSAEHLRDEIDAASTQLTLEFLRGDRSHTRQVTLQIQPKREAA